MEFVNYRLSKISPKQVKLLNYSAGKNYSGHERELTAVALSSKGSSTLLSLQFSLVHSSFRFSAFPLARLRPDTLAHIHRHMHLQVYAHILQGEQPEETYVFRMPENIEAENCALGLREISWISLDGSK